MSASLQWLPGNLTTLVTNIYGSKKYLECGRGMKFGTHIDVTILTQMRGSAKLNYNFLSNHRYIICLP